VHGNDERVSLENLKSGARVMYEVVARLAGARLPAR
jgi:acetylornithine deacetylase/succinyl-diaminopimelate desuccinylase-like protein